VDPRTILTRGVSTGLRLGRGTADRVVTLAGPPLGRLTDRVVSKVRRPDRPTTTTFTPSKQAERQAPAEPANQQPSPATVARNIGPQRPSAKPPRPAKPRSVPGAKLPPPRPSTT
jgi:hypothetical protein